MPDTIVSRSPGPGGGITPRFPTAPDYPVTRKKAGNRPDSAEDFSVYLRRSFPYCEYLEGARPGPIPLKGPPATRLDGDAKAWAAGA
jgi:hypothetical protein